MPADHVRASPGTESVTAAPYLNRVILAEFVRLAEWANFAPNGLRPPCLHGPALCADVVRLLPQNSTSRQLGSCGSTKRTDLPVSHPRGTRRPRLWAGQRSSSPI